MNDLAGPLRALGELLAVVAPEGPDPVVPAIELIAGAVGADVVAVVADGRVEHAAGPAASTADRLVGPPPTTSPTAADAPGLHRAPLDDRTELVVGRRAAAFDEQEQALLGAMARTLAVLGRLGDALAAERTARSAAERHAHQTTQVLAALRDRNHLLDRLAAVQRAISERAPTEELLSVVVEGLLEHSGAVGAALYLDDGRGTCVPLAVAGSVDPGAVSDASHPARVAVTDGRVAWRGPDPDAPPRWQLGVPVHRDGAVVGVLVLERDRPEDPDPDRPFRRSTADALASFADAASLALNDASARRALDEALSEALHQATHDTLTGLPNRAMVVDHLGRRLRGARVLGRASDVVVFFVDVDRFKQINDLLGHAAGDRFLQTLAERLRSHLREDDVVGRLSGDEFVVVTEQPDPTLADELASRLVRLLAAPVDLGGRATTPSVSIGIARARPDDDAESLLADADLAMYRAKQEGRGRHQHFDPALRVAAEASAGAEQALRRAIAERRFEVHYQPVVRLADRTVVAVEALVRWQHPAGHLALPSELLPLAEETGVLAELDGVVLRTACEQALQWRSSDGGRPLLVSVNVSAQRFADADLAEAVDAVLAETGLAPDRLFLEITESTMMDGRDAATGTMARLVDVGVRLAVDDFGNGWSSLRCLRQFPVGVLKVDRSFVRGLGTERDDEVIVEAVSRMAAALDIDVVAQGVETPLQARRLAELGCTFAQGHLFGPPADAASTERLLAEGILLHDA